MAGTCHGGARDRQAVARFFPPSSSMSNKACTYRYGSWLPPQLCLPGYGFDRSCNVKPGRRIRLHRLSTSPSPRRHTNITSLAPTSPSSPSPTEYEYHNTPGSSQQAAIRIPIARQRQASPTQSHPACLCKCRQPQWPPAGSPPDPPPKSHLQLARQASTTPIGNRQNTARARFDFCRPASPTRDRHCLPDAQRRACNPDPELNAKITESRPISRTRLRRPCAWLTLNRWSGPLRGFVRLGRRVASSTPTYHAS